MLRQVEQLSLMDGEKTIRAEQPVSEDVIFRQPNMRSAYQLSWQVSGLDDKGIYMPMQIDKATFSKIWSDDKEGRPLANMPTNADEQFMRITGNLIPLQWLAHRFGKGLYDLEDEKDRVIRELTNTVNEQKKEIETLVKYGVIGRAK